MESFRRGVIPYWIHPASYKQWEQIMRPWYHCNHQYEGVSRCHKRHNILYKSLQLKQKSKRCKCKTRIEKLVHLHSNDTMFV